VFIRALSCIFIREVCVHAETPYGNVDSCFAYFKDLVLCHAVKVCVFFLPTGSALENFCRDILVTFGGWKSLLLFFTVNVTIILRD